jgi:hypothetical protein
MRETMKDVKKEKYSNIMTGPAQHKVGPKTEINMRPNIILGSA